MTARALTFALPIVPARLARARYALRRLCGRPDAARTLFGAGDVHFASITLFDAPDARDPTLAAAGDLPPLLVLEQYVDAMDADAYARRLAGTCTADLHAILACCDGYRGDAGASPARIAAYLRAHRVPPAVYFAANPRASCARVRQEAALRDALRTGVAALLADGRIAAPRDAAALHLLARRATDASQPWVRDPHPAPTRLAAARDALRQLLTMHLLAAGVVATAPLLVAALLALRALERRDPSADPATLDPAHVRRLAAAEDRGGQNHLASVIVVKPGLLRQLALRVVLHGTALLAAIGAEGTLNGISSIHHAQWALLDGGRRLLFLTNYDGGWDGYLDDFVRFAAPGLTAIWSNVVGFPPTRFLFLAGAADGRTFKAYVRRQQTGCALRHADYPGLTVQQIAANCRLREGLARRPAGRHALAAWARTC